VNGASDEKPELRLRFINVKLERRAGGSVPAGASMRPAATIGGEEGAEPFDVVGELGGAFSLSPVRVLGECCFGEGPPSRARYESDWLSRTGGRCARGIEGIGNSL